METLAHGSVLEERDGLPARILDRHGRLALEAEWREGRLSRAELALPGGGVIELRPGGERHPLFGRTDEVVVGGETIACFQAVDWASPRAIPPLDRPSALPAGGGTAILNLLSLCARGRGLRYRGPYPTAALFDALLECFRVEGEPAEALSRFTRGAEESAAAARPREPDVTFRPAPFERVWFGDEVCVQLRDRLEKAWVRGRAYARDAAGARRVRREGEGWVAVLEIGGARWAEVARFEAQGELLSGPHPAPPVESPLVGRTLPPKVQELIKALLPKRAPALLRRELARLLEETEILWGDPGEAEAARAGERIVVHAGLAERLEAEPLLGALVVAIEPVAQRWAQSRLEAALL